MPLQLSCTDLQNAKHGYLFRTRSRCLARAPKCRRIALNTMAESSDSAGARVPAGQTVAAKLRRRVAIFVEPSPFSHVSGMKNRFECLIQGLRGMLQAKSSLCHLSLPAVEKHCCAELGDDVTVVTPDINPPKHYFGARVHDVLYAQSCVSVLRQSHFELVFVHTT